MREPLISVVVPVYNAEKYLEQCVQSIRAQTYANWELILVDDGSTDASPQNCDIWQGQDARIRVLHQPNSGVSRARNAGINAVKGKYLAFVDADDWVEPSYLATLYRTLISQSADLAVCCVYDTSDWNEKVRPETVSVQKLRTTPSQYANPVYTNYPCNKLFLTELIRQYHLHFPENVKRCEDAYFVADYLLHCQTVTVTTEKLYHYVQREGSAMHSFYEGVCDDEIPLMQIQYDLFHPQPLTKAEEEAYLLWEWGKVLAILRYIARYAPTVMAGTHYANKLILAQDSICHITKALQQCGRKGRLYSWLFKQRHSLFLLFLLRYFD